jgi:hypothetical protein
MTVSDQYSALAISHNGQWFMELVKSWAWWSAVDGRHTFLVSINQADSVK